MLQPKAKWNITEHNEEQILQLSSEWSLPPLIIKLLLGRGITVHEEVKSFLTVNDTHFHDPYLLDGMQQSVERIQKAIQSGEMIRIYGDYDADGVSSTSLMIHLFRSLGAQFDYYIPHRALEGYGLNLSALDDAKRNGVTLLITVDTGISAVEQIAYAATLGIDVIVTDHHEPPEVLPEAYAIINPKKPGCPYPFKQLAGVGVAFKLAHALCGRLPTELLELAVIGTVADLMPLVGENRMLVSMGMKQMRRTSNVGIRALIETAGVNLKQVNAGNVGFAMAPRINAGGRLEHANLAVSLLTTDREEEAQQLSYQLDQLNKERQRIVEEMTQDALNQIAAGHMESDKVLIISQENWNVGVIGIVASKIVERFYRPTIILSIDPDSGLCKGSARSIVGFDLYQAMTECNSLFEHYGGHQAAAGMTLHRDHLPTLHTSLNGLAEQWLNEEHFVPVLAADLHCNLDEVSMEWLQQLEMLEPFGMSNPSPRFVITGLQLKDMKTMGKEQQHVKLTLTQEGSEKKPIEAVAFNKPHYALSISITSKVDLLCELTVNEWNGMRKPQLLIHDIRVTQHQVFDWRGVQNATARLADCVMLLKHPSELAIIVSNKEEANSLQIHEKLSECGIWVQGKDEQCTPLNHVAETTPMEECKSIVLWNLPERVKDVHAILTNGHAMERIYAIFASSKENDKEQLLLPSRDVFKTIYGLLKQRAAWDFRSGELMPMLRQRSGLSPAAITFILRVFEELSFISKTNEELLLTESPKKQDLSDSPSYQARILQMEAEELFIYTGAAELSAWMIEQLLLHKNKTTQV